MKLKYLIRSKNFIQYLDKSQLIVCTFCLICFSIISTFVVTGAASSLDENLLVLIRQELPDWFVYVARISYFLGEAEVAGVFVFISLVVLVKKRCWEEAKVTAFSTLAILILIDRILKPFFAIPRPSERLVANAFGKSFPSGHAAGNLLLYFLWCYFISQKYPRLKPFLYSLATFLIILMGISSAYLRVHWVSDILASYCLGYGIFSLAIAILKIAKNNGGMLS
ncbi:MAG: phosphatase PAP2 family protein [Geminocystis sp.]|nr:phosphatase PAP2 family protein [Geminocystis sp.]MDW8116548.1 phosphatase PAP2 family protein [Geminocystis sp.]